LHDHALDSTKEHLRAAVEDGQAVVLLDGLDEVPRDEQKLFVRDAVWRFADSRFARSRMVVTCRVLSYKDKDWQLPEADFPSFELAPFDWPKIKRFVQGWYGEHCRLKQMAPDEARTHAQSLAEALRSSGLKELAGNPMLLTVMAHVHNHLGRLPDARARLYAEIVDLLLFRWKTAGLCGLLNQAHCDENDLKNALSQLAYQVHDPARPQAPAQPADINELELQDALIQLDKGRKSLDWARRVIESIKERAGLLIETTKHHFAFPHRSFQEFLAGMHLAGQPDFDQDATRLMEDGDHWREVIKWAAGGVVHVTNSPRDARDLVLALCEEARTGLASDRAWRKVALAGEVVLEMGVNKLSRLTQGLECLDTVRKLLVQLLEHEALTIAERAQAGMILGKLGDPRPRVGPSPTHPKAPDISWMPTIEPGPFLIGDDKLLCHLIQAPFQISKYPVTVAQYCLFVEVNGYERRAS
jgi:hypothetical protein